MGREKMTQTFSRDARFAAMALLATCTLSGCIMDGLSAAEREAKDAAKPSDRFQISDIIGDLQTAPDEFSVLTKRPLEMPSTFDALPVPEPGKLSSRDPNPIGDAQAALLGTAAQPTSVAIAPSATEAALLSSAGPAPANIRSVVAAEQDLYNSGQNQYVLDRIFPSLREARGETARGVINPELERQRLLDEGITSTQPVPTIAAPTVATIAAPQPVYVPAPDPIATVAPVPAAPAVSQTPTFGTIAPAPSELIYIPE